MGVLQNWLITNFVMLVTASTVSAQLKWDRQEAEFHPSEQDTKVEADFTFTNAGKYAVTITSLTVSCGCTTVQADKKTYKAGENGRVTAIFTIGDRTGLHKHTMTVQTDDPKNPATILTMRFYLPEFLAIAPARIGWKVGEDPKLKTISLKDANEKPINVLAVKSSNARVKAELKTIKPGKEYEVVVTPQDTQVPVMAELWIGTDYPPDKPRSFRTRAEIYQHSPSLVVDQGSNVKDEASGASTLPCPSPCHD